MDLQGKRAVVTGAASGIGEALCRRLPAHGCRVVGADKNSRGAAHLFQGDLRSPEVVDALFEYAVAEMGGIDIFFANAGFGYYESIEQDDWSHIEEIFKLNVFSAIYAAEKMRSLNAGREYRVVMTSSTAGRIAMQGYALYGATKAALDRFAEGYRMELERKNSLVMIYPLAVRSSFCSNAGNAPLAWPRQSPEQVADAIIRGLQRDKKDIYSSPILRAMLLTSYYLPLAKRPYQAMESLRFRMWSAKQRGKCG